MWRGVFTVFYLVCWWFGIERFCYGCTVDVDQVYLVHGDRNRSRQTIQYIVYRLDCLFPTYIKPCKHTENESFRLSIPLGINQIDMTLPLLRWPGHPHSLSPPSPVRTSPSHATLTTNILTPGESVAREEILEHIRSLNRAPTGIFSLHVTITKFRIYSASWIRPSENIYS